MKKRLLSIFLCIAMLLSVVPARAFAEEGPAAYDVTDDLSELISDIEIIGLDVDEDGNYQVHANQPYSLKVTFKEKADLEMDMTGSVHYALPRGLVSPNESNTIDIGVVDGYYKSITHDATILDNVLTITWNQDDENFPDLARAHYVEFTVNVRGTFDGSEGEIVIGDEEERRIVVDNTGSVTVVKNVTGLKPGVSLSAEEQEAMTFELVNSIGTVVKTFTYADLVRGTISFDKMKPGAYTVRETNHPDPANYTFDTADSVLSATGTLIPGGSLTLTLSNDYDYDTGALELSKDITVQNWDGTTTVPQAVTNGISYTITGPDGYKNTVYYTDFVNGKLTLSDLEVGDYTVTEKSTVPGYTWTYTVDGATPDYPIATVTVTKDGTATVAYANNYVQQTGNVTIVKTATGGVTIPEGTQFKVTYPDGTTTKTFTYAQMSGGTYTLSNVPLGTYKVEEITSTAQVNNYSLTVTGTGDVKLEIADATATATIVNQYSPLGSLKVLKTVAGDLAASDLTATQQKNIKFTIKNSANTTVKVLSLYDILKGNNTVSDLPVGTYTVTESNPAVDGYTVVIDPSSKKVTVNVTVGETATASFTNTYTKKVYTLTVNKTFGENSFYTADTLPANFKSGTTFTIKDSSGTVVKTCTYEELATAMNGIELPGPGPYTVSESNPRVPGIGVYTTVSKNGGTAASGTSASITLEDHQPATVTFENNYVSEGKIKGEKLIEGLPPFETEALKNEIKFTIYQKQNGTFVMYKENISIAELASGITVPAGEYYV